VAILISKQLDDAGHTDLTNLHLQAVVDTYTLHFRLDVSGTLTLI